MVFRSSLWLLLVACAAAYQSYDDGHLQNLEDNIVYNDDRYTDIDYGLPTIREDFPKDLMMYKVINRLRKRSGEEVGQPKRPKIDSLEHNLPLGVHKRSEDDLKAATLERKLVEASKSDQPGNKKVTKYQPRWRFKYPGLCLLKLCAMPRYVYE